MARKINPDGTVTKNPTGEPGFKPSGNGTAKNDPNTVVGAGPGATAPGAAALRKQPGRKPVSNDQYK